MFFEVYDTDNPITENIHKAPTAQKSKHQDIN